VYNHPTSKKPFFQREWLFSVVSLGLVLVLLGIVYLLYPGNVIDDMIKFFENFTLSQFPSTDISLPAPISLAANLPLFTAAFEFALGVSSIEIVMLLMRIVFHSNSRRIAETVGNLVFWFGLSYMVYAYLITAPSVNKWFLFWAGIIVVLGLSLIARAFVDLGYKWKKRVAVEQPHHQVPYPPPPQYY
jgi:hypothetical protein